MFDCPRRKRKTGLSWLFAALCLGLVACHRHPPTHPKDQKPADYYGRLPGLSRTAHPGLQAELARIIDEGGTPELLAAETVPEPENAAAGLLSVLDREQALSILEQSDSLVPKEGFQLSAERAAAVDRLLERYAPLRSRVEKMLRRTKSHFGIDFLAGFQADLSCIEVTEGAARLEMLAAVAALGRDDLQGATDSWGRILRLAACLAMEKHPTTRLRAVSIRQEAARLLEAILQHSGLRREHLDALWSLARQQLEDWPPDRLAWIGDRALGMWVYEVTRDGRLWEILTSEEKLALAEAGILSQMPQIVRQGIDGDQWYYLQAMRKIIDTSSRPYYRRKEVFQGIREDLHARRNDPQFPWVAGRLLLLDMEKGHERQAADRARWEAILLGLATATDRPSLVGVNPRTGKPYRVIVEEARVTVWDIEPDWDVPVIVPKVADGA